MRESVRTVFAVKEGRLWYIDDDNGFSHEDNQLVAGIPEIIEAMVGPAATRVRMEYSTEPRADALHLRLVSSLASGSVYSTSIGGSPMTGWLCPVFRHYFPEAPQDLFVTFTKAG
jgi:hypothetical protein